MRQHALYGAPLREASMPECAVAPAGNEACQQRHRAHLANNVLPAVIPTSPALLWLSRSHSRHFELCRSWPRRECAPRVCPSVLSPRGRTVFLGQPPSSLF